MYKHKRNYVLAPKFENASGDFFEKSWNRARFNVQILTDKKSEFICKENSIGDVNRKHMKDY